jgi:hypothetical protein
MTYPVEIPSATRLIAGVAAELPQLCRACGARLAEITPDARLVCRDCGGRRGTLSDKTVEFLVTLIGCFGPIRAPVVFRRPAPSDK